MNIKDLLEEDGFSCKYIAKTYGGTFASPCPKCGGTDRFRCFPNNGYGGNYLCQKCGLTGNIIKYLTEFRGMDRSSAIVAAGNNFNQNRKSDLRSIMLNKTPVYGKSLNPPCHQWQQQAFGIIKSAEEELWKPENIKFVDWLIKRGLTHSSIRKYKLGYIPADIYQDKSIWGVADVNNRSETLFIPSGIVIPCFGNKDILRLRIRRFEPNTSAKYHLISGSKTKAMIKGSGTCHILVESELDALLLEQEAGDLVTIIALGSAQNKPDIEIMTDLKKSDLVLLALDNDQAGATSFYKWWMSVLPNSKRWTPLKGKDPGESYQNGVNIRKWVLAGILKYISNTQSKINSNKYHSNQGIKLSGHQFSVDLNELAAFKNKNAIIIDLITTGDDPFNDSIKEIHLTSRDPKILKLQKDDILNKAKDDLESILASDNYKIFYNGKPQMLFLEMNGFHVNGNIFDQKIAEEIIYTGSKNIDARKTIEQIKSDNKNIVETLGKYGLKNVSSLESACLPVMVKMEKNGILIDHKKLSSLLNELEHKIIPLQKEICDFLGKINLNSTKELANALGEKDIIKKCENKTNKEILIPLIHSHPIVKKILDHRKLQASINKCKEISKNINACTGRIHPAYDQVKDTGRMSCKKPNLHGTPKRKEFRELFIASKGCKIIRADFSQIELRVAAEISEDIEMIEAFKKKQDFHALTACLMMDKPIGQITKIERQKAKPVNFGLLFDMSPHGLQRTAFIDYDITLTEYEAINFKTKIYSVYQGLAKWQQAQRIKTETRTLLGRRRIWKGMPRSTQLLNSPIQGTAADILKQSLVILAKNLSGTGAKIIGTVHDEILVEALEYNVNNVAEITKNSMIEAGNWYLKNVPIEVDVSISSCWK